MTNRLPRVHKALFRVSSLLDFSMNHRLTFLPRQRAIWYRVPKVGSTTLKAMFDGAVEVDQIELPGRAQVPGWIYKGWVRFAFVRRPDDRIISAWKDKVIRHNFFEMSEEQWAAAQNLDGFLDWLASQDLSRAEPHVRLQSSLMPVEQMDFVGKLETFERDWKELAHRLGLSVDPSAEPKNKSNAIELPHKVTEAHRQRILHLYAADVEAFYPELSPRA